MFLLRQKTSTTYYYSDMTSSRKKKACGSACCCIFLLLFLLLFFLIPRNPDIIIQSVTVTGTPSNPIINGNFQLRNNNFYKMEYSDLNVNIGQLGTTNDYYGTGSYSNTIDLGIRQKTALNVTITPTTPGKLASLVTPCFVPGTTVVNTASISGTVNAQTNGAVHKNFGTVNIAPENLINVWNC